MKKNVKIFLPAIGWLIIVTALFCIPGTRFPKITWQNKILLDKWIHLFLFLVLVLVWCRAYFRRDELQNHKADFLAITIFSIVYGIAIELLQEFFIPFRSFDLFDITADSLGALAGYLISVKQFRKINT